ncbi:MAG: CapA family protein [Gammaproteobacteria bacterium]|nr:CapA family protein [Gammaproteobacteria bacterium]
MIRKIGKKTLGLTVIVSLLSACAAVPDRIDPIPVDENRAVPAETPLTLAATGDIMMDGSARPEFSKLGYDYAFEYVGDILRKADIAIGNLEGPLTTGGNNDVEKKYVFRSPPDKVATSLVNAGFDVFTLANNHTLDYGVQGLVDTMAALDRHGLAYSGAGLDSKAARKAVILERKNRRIAFLGYSLTFPEEFWAAANRPGTAFGHESHVRKDVAKAKAEADIVIVSFHWGREGTTELRPYQTALGRAAIDAGAAAVLGHHPHILQGVERYKHGVILYSLGNFVFGSYSRKARTSVIAQLSFDGNVVSSVEMVPINVFNPEVVFQPKILTGKQAASVLSELDGLSRPMGVAVKNVNNVGLVGLTGTDDSDVSLLAR